MKQTFVLIFFILGKLNVFLSAQDFENGVTLNEFLDQCSATKEDFDGCTKKCFRFARNHMECGFTSFLNNTIVLQTRTNDVEVELANFQDAFDQAQISTQNSLSALSDELSSVENNLTSLASTAATIDDVSQMNDNMVQLNSTLMDSCATIENLLAIQSNHTESIEDMCSELASHNETIECMIQDIQSCESWMVEMNNTINLCSSEIECIQDFQANLSQSIAEINYNMSCISDTVEENTCAINNLTAVTEELIARIVELECQNSDLMSAISSPESGTVDNIAWIVPIQAVNNSAFEAIEELASCQQQQELMIEDLNCSLTQSLYDMECCLNDTMMETQKQALMIAELEATVMEQEEINSNLSARICELENMTQACHEEMNIQCSRIDELEAMMQSMEMMLMKMNETQCMLMEQIELLQEQVNEQNCTFTECLEDMQCQQQTMMEQMEDINCTVMMHQERICQLDDCMTSFMGSSGYECIPMNGSSSEYTITPVPTVSTPEAGSTPEPTITPAPTVSTPEAGTTEDPSNSGSSGSSLTPAITDPENDDQLCDRLEELDTKVDALLASIPLCPAGFVTLYRDEERTLTPICIKFELVSEDFCYHEHHCLLQGLKMAEIEGNYTMCELNYYAQTNPVVSSESFFIGAKYDETAGEWQWLCGTPVSDELLAHSELVGGTGNNCASFNAATSKLECTDCNMDSYALCMI